MDEDDDDLFAEFDVDLDMDKETSVPPKAASSPPTSSATDDAAPHDTLMNDASVEVAQAAAEPALDMSSAEATKDDHNYTDAGAAPETGKF